MDHTYHPALQPGQSIGVMAPSSYVERADIEAAATLLRERGYSVFIHPQTYERAGQSAGTTLQKSMALQGLWQRKDIDVIWFAGGGNQAMPLLKSLNFETMKRVQKTVLGFSDTTCLLNAITAHTGFQTCHAPVFKSLHRMQPDHLDTLLSALQGNERQIMLSDRHILKAGEAEGTLFGGNLSLMQYMPALLPDDYLDGAILFLEDCNIELSHIDRIFTYLDQSGVLTQIGGLALGQFTNLLDTGRPFGLSFRDIIDHHTGPYNIPVLWNLDFGHDLSTPFIPLSVGCIGNISTKNNRFLW